MACNVFGNPIDYDFLRSMPKYHDQTQFAPNEYAAVALDMKNAGGIDFRARNHVWSLKKVWDQYMEKAKSDCNIKDKTCFCVLIYNATGGTLTYLAGNDKAGSLGHAPHPSSIENGQWGAFLHVQSISETSGSTGAVVYRGKSNNGVELDWIVMWNNPGPDDMTNIKICGAVLKSGTDYTSANEWYKIYDKMDNKNTIRYYEKPGNGGVFDGTSGRGVAPIFEAVLTLEQVG